MEHLSSSAAAGFVAGGVTRMVTAPLDVLKIRLQLQRLNNPLYPSATQAFLSIIKNEGTKSLWKGNLCATYLWLSYGMVQFGLYDFLKQQVNIKNTAASAAAASTCDAAKKGDLLASLSLAFWSAAAENKPLASFVMGSLAASAATAASYPFDLMRTQFAVQGNKPHHRSLLGFVGHTLSSRGVPGLYAGLFVTVGGIAPAMGLNFTVYELALPRLKGCIDLLEEGLGTGTDTRSRRASSDSAGGLLVDVLSASKEALCGALSGGMSKLATYPLDSLKRRMQLQSVQCSFTVSTMGHALHAAVPTPLQGVGNLAPSAASTTAKGCDKLPASVASVTEPASAAPADVVPKFRNVLACIRWTWANEGMRGFYKGLVPSLVKSMLSTGIMFSSFQVTKDFLDRSQIFR